MDPPEDSLEPSFYAVLNVPRDASYEDIKKAYKNLAQVFHPDKHLDDHLRDKAQEAFSRLNEAYEVLSDPQKRDVYDVYGKEGLAAGLSVGTKLKGTDELRREWEAFKAQQRRAREEALASHRGTYICKVDGRGWAHADWKQLPQIRMVVVQNSLDVAITDADVAVLQGQAALRGHQGSGSVIAGYKRVLSPNDELEANAVLGLHSLLSVTSTRRLGHYTTAALTGSYSIDQGMGLQVTTSRQLHHNTSGSLTWVIGPPAASSMGFSTTHRASKFVITGKLDLGVVTAISSRFTYLINDTLSLRLIGRVGTSGVDAELGLSRRFSPSNTLYAGSSVSLHGGTCFKVRYSRAGQSFEFPILLTGDYRDWELLVAATLVPPLTSWLLMRYVVRPLKTWQQRRADRLQRSEHAELLRREAARAAAERALLQPVAKRKALAEASGEGLADKELYVAYCYKRQLFEKVVGDTELLRLPGAGEPVCETSIAERLWAKYRRGYQEHVQQQK
eukprot:gene1748-2089_t